MTDDPSDQAETPAAPKSVRLVRLPLAALTALAGGDLAAASAAAGIALTRYFLTAEALRLWWLRADQVTADPESGRWIARAAVAEPDGVVVGHAGFHAPPDAAGMVEVAYSVDPVYRRQGYATAMLRELLRRAAAEPGVTTVRASIRPDNAGSLATIAGFGFTRHGGQRAEEEGRELICARRAGQRPPCAAGPGIEAEPLLHRNALVRVEVQAVTGADELIDAPRGKLNHQPPAHEHRENLALVAQRGAAEPAAAARRGDPIGANELIHQIVEPGLGRHRIGRLVTHPLVMHQARLNRGTDKNPRRVLSSVGDGHDDVGSLDHRGDLAALGQAELACRLLGDRGNEPDPARLQLDVGDRFPGDDAGDPGRDLVSRAKPHDMRSPK